MSRLQVENCLSRRRGSCSRLTPKSSRTSSASLEAAIRTHHKMVIRRYKPLFLRGIKKADFRSFLNILSARHYEAVTAGNVVGKTNLLLTRYVNRATSQVQHTVNFCAHRYRFPLYPPMTKDEWTAALRLSHMWVSKSCGQRRLRCLRPTQRWT